MKVEHSVYAPYSLQCNSIQKKVGDHVRIGEPILQESSAFIVYSGHTFIRSKTNIKQHGGSESIIRQKKQGKLLARERIQVLVDKGSFFEIGSSAGTASNFIGGF